MDGTKQQFDRVFFIVDRSRLKDERDELKNAIVVYIPEKDLSRPTLEQRCSQLVGISILINLFTGKLPKFIRLRSIGFAIKNLGPDLIMGLQSKLDEPKECVFQLINRVHDFFNFYYSSPEMVMKMALNDWEIFTAQMNAIFQCILDFALKESRSLPSMFNPIPYIPLDYGKGGSQLYIKAQRLLRFCQLNESVIGGCIFYDGSILCSQLPPEMGEKLLLVATGGIELNSRSVLEEQIAPESVWVINIYLTEDQLALSDHIRRRVDGLKSMYKTGLKPDPNLDVHIQAQQRYENAHVPAQNSNKQTKLDNKGRLENKEKKADIPDVPPFGEDFVTISYGSDTVAYTKKAKVNPLKRSKIDGKRNLDGKNRSGIARNIFDPLPPLPPAAEPRANMPSERFRPTASLPPHTHTDKSGTEIPYAILRERYEMTEPNLHVPAVPPQKNSALQDKPIPPPRKADQPPTIPPRLSPRHNRDGDSNPPPPPPRKRIVMDPVKSMPIPNGTRDEEVSSPGVYGTPCAWIESNSKSKHDESDFSDTDGFTTPPPASPSPVGVPIISEADSSLISHSHQSFFTPPNVKSEADISHDGNLATAVSKSASDVLDNGSDEEKIVLSSGSHVLIDDDENHYEFNSSLEDHVTTVTKAVSEVWSNNEETLKSGRAMSMEESIRTEDQSPVSNELMDSINTDLVGDLQRDRFMAAATMKNEKWSTLLSPSQNSIGDDSIQMHKKCLYIQKCYSTVVAILTDDDLPSSTDLIKSLWTTLLSSLVTLNNNVEPVMKDIDSIYSPADIAKSDAPSKTYHAGYSSNIAMCEVSSLSAPYHFRHAVRRIHQEYTKDHTLRQVSLSKDVYRVVSQNVLGREMYYHSTRVGSNDSLISHAMLEKQARVASKQKYVSENYVVDFL